MNRINLILLVFRLDADAEKMKSVVKHKTMQLQRQILLTNCYLEFLRRSQVWEQLHEELGGLRNKGSL